MGAREESAGKHALGAAASGQHCLPVVLRSVPCLGTEGRGLGSLGSGAKREQQHQGQCSEGSGVHEKPKRKPTSVQLPHSISNLRGPCVIFLKEPVGFLTELLRQEKAVRSF